MKNFATRNLPPEVAEALEREKRRRGESLNRTVIELLQQGLGVGTTRSNGPANLAVSRTGEDPGAGGVRLRLSTAGGILFAKIINPFLREGRKINPCIGAAGVSAVPMSARVVQPFVLQETNGRVNPLMPAMGPNVAGVIGSAVAARVFLTMLG